MPFAPFLSASPLPRKRNISKAVAIPSNIPFLTTGSRLNLLSTISLPAAPISTSGSTVVTFVDMYSFIETPTLTSAIRRMKSCSVTIADTRLASPMIGRHPTDSSCISFSASLIEALLSRYGTSVFMIARISSLTAASRLPSNRLVTSKCLGPPHRKSTMSLHTMMPFNCWVPASAIGILRNPCSSIVLTVVMIGVVGGTVTTSSVATASTSP